MDYLVMFTYNDGKELHLQMTESEFNELWSKLSRNEIYWNQEAAAKGLWLNLDKIRFLEVREVEKEEEDPPIRKPDPDHLKEIWRGPAYGKKELIDPEQP